MDKYKDKYRQEEDIHQEEPEEYREIVVDRKQTPIRIDKFLIDRLVGLSRSKIQNAIKSGLITVNLEATKANYKVAAGDSIRIVYPPSDYPTEVLPEEIPLDIRYEDEDLIILHKPAGLVVHPGVGNYTGTLVNALANHFQNLPSAPGDNLRPGLVHRIDKDTTGLMVVAKNEMSMFHLAKQFYDHSIVREYIALVWGNFEQPRGTVEGHIGRDPKHRKKMTVFQDGNQGKKAITHFELIEDLYYVSVIKCQLETGRTHQIRVHMQSIGHPLFNDVTYGGDKILKGTIFSKYKQFVTNAFTLVNRHCLHAKSLGFIHPRTKKKMHFDSEIPDDMSQVIVKWRNYVRSRKELL